MKNFLVKGPSKGVKGSIVISGAKNSCLPLMASSLLFKKHFSKRCNYYEKSFNSTWIKSRNFREK